MAEPFALHLGPHEEQTLLDVAEASIRQGLVTGHPSPVDASAYSAALQEWRATFVTLRKCGELRGCMGATSAIEPLVADVAHNAYAAAFRDPRFPAVTNDEVAQLEYQISILSESEPIEFESEAELLVKIRPHVDGLTIREGHRRGTLLPAVWEHVATPREFLAHLKKKAGLSPGYWSNEIRVNRYTTYSIGPE